MNMKAGGNWGDRIAQ